MGLDLYTGSIARWSVGDWETASAAAARSMGMSHRTIRANALPSDTPQYREDIRAAWTGWRDWLAPQLNGAGPQWLDSDDTPYSTRQCPYDCYFALVSWAARLVHPAPNPPWPIPPEYSDQVVASVLEAGDALAQDLQCSWWFPGPFNGVIQAPTPFSEIPIAIGSTSSLIEKLQAVNGASWQAPDAQIEAWANEGPPAVGDVVYEIAPKKKSIFGFKQKDLKPVVEPPPADGVSSYERSARYACAALLQTAREAEANRTPLLLDM